MNIYRSNTSDGSKSTLDTHEETKLEIKMQVCVTKRDLESKQMMKVRTGIRCDFFFCLSEPGNSASDVGTFRNATRKYANVHLTSDTDISAKVVNLFLFLSAICFIYGPFCCSWALERSP